jgi:hypothetical protein
VKEFQRWRRYVPQKRRLNFQQTTRRYITEDSSLYLHPFSQLEKYNVIRTHLLNTGGLEKLLTRRLMGFQYI